MHLAYCYYFATGEGMTIYMALGGSAEHAERIFNEIAPEFFRPGLTIHEVGTKADKTTEGMLKMIPEKVLEIFNANPPGTTDWSSHLHYNLS